MKKILATLLVATILMSCMAFVSFAEAATTVYLSESFSLSKEWKSGIGAKLKDPFTYQYYSAVLAAYESGDATVENSPIFLALYEIVEDKGATTDSFDALNGDFSLKPDEYLGVPIYVNGVGEFQLMLNYDPEYLSPVISTNLGYIGKIGQYDDNTLFVAGTTQGAGDANGLFGTVLFKVKSATGDSECKATTNVSLAFENAAANPDQNSVIKGSAGVGSLGTVTNMSVSLTGLEKGEEEEKDPTPITQTEVNAMTAVKTGGAIAAGTNVLEGITVDGGDGADVSEAEAYSAVFATINLTDKDKTNVEFGFILRAKDGSGADRFFKAEKEYGGKYGVAFFGTSEVLGWYKAVPAVKLADGTILENASAAKDL